MDEQINVGSTAQRTSRAVPMLVVLILIAAAVVGAYVVMSKRSIANDPASYIPQEVSMAMTIDLRSTEDKKAAIDVINGLVAATGEKKKPLEMLFEQIGEEMQIDFNKQIISHLNGTGAAAVLTELSGMIPEAVIVVGAKSKADADAVIAVISSQLTKAGARHGNGSYQGVSYFTVTVGGSPSPTGFGGAPQVTNCIGAVKSMIVYADSESGFKKVVDTANGKASLLADSNYTSLRKTGPKVFATTYLSGTNLYKLIGPFIQMAAAMAAPGTTDGLKDEFESVTAMVGSAEASADGLKYTQVCAQKDRGCVLTCYDIDDMVKDVPKDAALVLSLGNFSELWSEYQKQLARNPAAMAQIDKAINELRLNTGLDLRADILDRVKSLQAYYLPGEPAQPDGFPGEINAILQVDKPEMVAKTEKKIHTLAAASGQTPFTQMTLDDGQSAFVTDLGQGDKMSDVLIGDKLLLLASGDNKLKGAVNRLKNPGPGLKSNQAFQLVKSQLAPKSALLVYGNAGAILDKVAKNMSPKERKIADTILKKVCAFGMSASGTATRSEMEFVIPFAK